VSARRRWSELSERKRKLIMFGVAFEGALKVAALVDIARRPASEIRGSKIAWGTAVLVVNAFGAVPVAYFALGRQPDDERVVDVRS
jgi:hypothetical protein